MGNNPNSSIQGHEPLRVPSDFSSQGKRFVAQLEEILDDIYRRFGRLKVSDLGTALQKTITDAEGNAAEAIRTASSFEERIKNAEGDASEAIQTVGSFDNRITTAEGNASQALQTVGSFDNRITTAEGNASQALQTVGSFDNRITTAEGNASQALQTVGGFETRITTAEGNASSANQTANELKTVVVRKDGVMSAINQSAEEVKINANKITLEGVVTANDNFQIQTDGSMKCKNAEMSGVLKTEGWTFDGNGSNYSDGSIGVNMTVLSGNFVGGEGSGKRAFYGSSGCDVQYGADYNKTAYMRAGKIKVVAQDPLDMSSFSSVEFVRSDSGEASIVCGESTGELVSGKVEGSVGNLGLPEKYWDYTFTRVLRAVTYPGSSSRSIKKDIEALPEMGSILDALVPVSFAYKGDPEKLRYGLIYEDTKEVMPVICFDDGKGDPGIVYTDLIAPMLKEIQSLRLRVKELETKE